MWIRKTSNLNNGAKWWIFTIAWWNNDLHAASIFDKTNHDIPSSASNKRGRVQQFIIYHAPKMIAILYDYSWYSFQGCLAFVDWVGTLRYLPLLVGVCHRWFPASTIVFGHGGYTTRNHKRKLLYFLYVFFARRNIRGKRRVVDAGIKWNNIENSNK